MVGWCYYDEQVCGGQWREANRLMWMADTATWSHTMPNPKLPLRALSASVTLLQLGCVLMSVAQDTNEDHMSACGLALT